MAARLEWAGAALLALALARPTAGRAGALAFDCGSADLTQRQLDACAGRDFAAADGRLNAVYRALMARYTVADQALLRAAERAWLGYRDAECAYETNGAAGGTIRPMLETLCRTRLTEARAKTLAAQRDCADGDLSCNAPGR